MNDDRQVRVGGEERGTYSVADLYNMAERGEIDHTAQFWSERLNNWRPIAGIIFDLYPSRLDDMKSAGITKVEILGSGSGDECPACKSLLGRKYPIAEVPDLPPEACACIPWCRCIEVAKQ